MKQEGGREEGGESENMHPMDSKYCYKLVSIHFMVNAYSTSPPMSSVQARVYFEAKAFWEKISG